MNSHYIIGTTKTRSNYRLLWNNILLEQRYGVAHTVWHLTTVTQIWNTKSRMLAWAPADFPKYVRRFSDVWVSDVGCRVSQIEPMCQVLGVIGNQSIWLGCFRLLPNFPPIREKIFCFLQCLRRMPHRPAWQQRRKCSWLWPHASIQVSGIWRPILAKTMAISCDTSWRSWWVAHFSYDQFVDLICNRKT